MSNLILPRRLREGRQVVGPRNQRGFIINPYVFGGGGGGTDPYIAYRKTIANLDTDLSDPLRTWTANGGAAVSSGWLTLDGAGDYLATPQSTDLDPGAGEFCVEAFIEIAGSPPGDASIFAKWSAAFGLSYMFGIDSARRLFLYHNTSVGPAFPVGSNVVPTGTPTHVAAYRVGSNFYAAIAGVPQVILTSASAISTISSQVTIGTDSGGSASPFTGLIKAVRMTTGSTGGYGASSFTPPTPPLPTS